MRKGFFTNVLAVTFLLLVFTSGHAADKNSDQKVSKTDKLQDQVHFKLPDGLYLYHSSFKNLKKEVISPLVIVKNGKFVDPYDLTNKIGIQNFTKEYIDGKEFTVCKGSEKYGKIDKINLGLVNKCKINDFIVSEFISDITGNGRYGGKPLNDQQPDIRDTFGKIVGATRTIIVPLYFQQKNNAAIFLSLTESDKKTMIDAFRKKILRQSMKQLDKFLKKKNKQIITEDKSRLFAAEAIDLNGNGEKDSVGIYKLSVRESTGGLSSISIPFVLWDTGKIEKISSNSSLEFSFIGVIDVDQDGIQELVVQHEIEVYREGLYTGRQIEIIQHTESGWKNIYKSKAICDPLSFYYY